MIGSLVRRLLRDTHGGAATVAALSLPVMIGGVGLAVDVGHWYQIRRSIQTQADAAAYAAALDLARQGLDGTVVAAGLTAAAQDAADRNASTGAVAVHHPPVSGDFVGDTSAVEVVVTSPAGLFFSRLFLEDAPTVSARAVARAVVADACIWALDPSERGALTVAGNSTVDLSCGVVVNSNHPQAALDQFGNSCLTATSMTVAGGFSGDCLNPTPESFMAPLGDPLASIDEPTVGGCDHNSKINARLTGDGPVKVVTKNGNGNNGGGNSGPTVLSPGVYCGGLQINGDVIFEPGEYVIKGGSLLIAGTATVTNHSNGSGGVTFFLTGSGNNYAEVDIRGGATVELNPRTIGPRANVLFMQDRSAPANGTHKFSGGSTMNLTGIVYIPNQAVEFTGGSSGSGADVLLVADTLTFSGNSYLNADYAQSLLPNEYYARLVE